MFSLGCAIPAVRLRVTNRHWHSDGRNVGFQVQWIVPHNFGKSVTANHRIALSPLVIGDIFEVNRTSLSVKRRNLSWWKQRGLNIFTVRINRLLIRTQICQNIEQNISAALSGRSWGDWVTELSQDLHEVHRKRNARRLTLWEKQTFSFGDIGEMPHHDSSSAEEKRTTLQAQQSTSKSNYLDTTIRVTQFTVRNCSSTGHIHSPFVMEYMCILPVVGAISFVAMSIQNAFAAVLDTLHSFESPAGNTLHVTNWLWRECCATREQRTQLSRTCTDSEDVWNRNVPLVVPLSLLDDVPFVQFTLHVVVACFRGCGIRTFILHAHAEQSKFRASGSWGLMLTSTKCV